MAKNFEKSKVKKAIEDSDTMSDIARKLKCDWMTAEKYVKKFDLYDEFLNKKEALVDLAETKLRDKIRQGDTAAILFTLKTVGKSRGYIERREVDMDGSKIVIEAKMPDEN